MKTGRHSRFVTGNRMQSRFAPGDRSRIEEAKSRVSIFAAWRELMPAGDVPARDGVYDAPWATNHGSLSVFNDGQAFRDHAGDDRGDVVCFIEKLLRCSRGDAIRQLYRIAGMDTRTPRSAPVVVPVRRFPERMKSPPAKWKRTLPPLRTPTTSELASLIRLRGLGPAWAGLEIMHRWGLLFAAGWTEGEERDIPCFILTDDDRKTALRRRMDGRHWAEWSNAAGWTPGAGGKGKTWVSEEGGKSPVGLSLLRGLRFDAETVFVVEGSPDAWALFALAWDFYGSESAMRCFSVVVMPDAGTRLTDEQAALVAKAGRRVVIVAQDDRHAKPDKEDDTGEKAAQEWALRLYQAGAYVEILRLHSEEADFLPPAGKDLCDAAAHASAQHPDECDEPTALSRAIFAGAPSAFTDSKRKFSEGNEQ